MVVSAVIDGQNEEEKKDGAEPIVKKPAPIVEEVEDYSDFH